MYNIVYMDSNQEKTVAHIANGMLETLTLTQVMQICRDFSYLKAEEYYADLKDEEKKELDNKIEEALKAQQQSPPS